MSPRRPEVADVLKTFASAFCQAYSVSAEQERVLTHLPLCRTASLGGHRLECDKCGHQEISYNSCRNRHCPKCRAGARAEWLQARQTELLDVPYFHVVFTLPEELAAIVLQNKSACYGLLFRAAAETLRTIAADPKHLGAQIGFFAVLHTWNQTLLHHPHVHCVVPGGGISADKTRWTSCRQGFFLPVRVLSRLFRRLYLQGLEDARQEGDLGFHGKLKGLRDATVWARTIAAMRAKEWVVYAKPPFGGPTQVLKYLARYTHRVAISNQRIIDLDDRCVRFRWKDRSGSATATKVMKLSGVEFTRRFLLHVLPRSFVSIRHFGFLANRGRTANITLARQLIAAQQPKPQATDPETPNAPTTPALHANACPRCETGQLTVIEEIPPKLPAICDTS